MATGTYTPGSGGTSAAFPGTGGAAAPFLAGYGLSATDAQQPVVVDGTSTTIGAAVTAFEGQSAAIQDQLSQTLISAGFLKPTGASDPVSVTDAYIQALKTAASSKTKDLATTIEDWTQETNGANSVSATIDLTNPLDVAYASNTIAQQLIGRKLTQKEIDGITTALQGEQVSAGTQQAEAQISQVTGGAVGSTQADPGVQGAIPMKGSGPQAFVNMMAPYAQEASQATGINANVILAQWGNETAWGTSHAFTKNFNPAGIGITGSGVAGKNYGSIAGGVSAYIAFVNGNSRYQKVKAAGINDPAAQAYAFGQSGWAAGGYLAQGSNVKGSALIEDMQEFTAPTGVTPATGLTTPPPSTPAATASSSPTAPGTVDDTQIAPGASVITSVQPTSVDAETDAYLSQNDPGEYQGHELLGVFQAIADKVANDTQKVPKALTGPVKIT